MMGGEEGSGGGKSVFLDELVFVLDAILKATRVRVLAMSGECSSLSVDEKQ